MNTRKVSKKDNPGLMRGTAMKIRSILALTSALAGSVLLNAGPAVAQEAAKPAPDAGEIVVTAQRRNESLKDVPMTITALNSDMLTKAGVTSTQDLSRVAAGVSMPMQGGWLQPVIRGVTSVGSNLGDNSNVALYIDGIYQPQQIASLIDMPDVEQIEILKGPQGALYGQNATGGAILVNSLAPSFTTKGQFSASYGTYNDVQLRGYLTGALTEKLALSVSGGYQYREGFFHQVITNERSGPLDSKVIRAKALWEPAAGAKITLTGYYTDRLSSDGFTSVPYKDNSSGYTYFPNAPRPTSANQYASNSGNYFDTVSYGGSIKGAFDVGLGTINTTTSISRAKTHYNNEDVDFSSVNIGIAGPGNLQARYFIQEMNFVSKSIGKVNFLAGAFYMNGSEEFLDNGFQLFVPTLAPTPPGTPVFRQDLHQRLDKEVYALYAEVNYDLTDQLKLTAGGRYSSETQHGFSNYIPFGNPVLVERTGGPLTFSQFSPRVNIRYAVTPDTNVYASWSKGFKSGIINVGDLNQVNPVRPEILTSYEVGVKSRPAPGVALNMSAFWYEYKDMQFTAYDAPNFLQQNAASARIKGIDFDAKWDVSHEFTLSAGAEYLDAKYVRFPDAAVFVRNGNGAGFGNTQITEDLSGTRMIRAPKLSLNASANYKLNTAVGTFGAFASVAYNSGYGFEVGNYVQQPRYATIDGELSYSPASVPALRFAIWGKNLTNKLYYSQSIQTNYGDGVSYAPPRTFGIRAEYAF